MCRLGSPVAYLVFSAIALIGCTLDLVTKHWVFQWRGMPPAAGPRSIWWLWDGYIGIETATNPGALFGMGKGFVAVIAILSVVAACGIIYWLVFAGGARDRLLTVALGSIMGGILGNLYDRLGLWTAPGMSGGRIHEVRDWILFEYQGHTWPNFNIADCLLVGGASVLVLHAIVNPQPPAAAPSESTPN